MVEYGVALLVVVAVGVAVMSVIGTSVGEIVTEACDVLGVSTVTTATTC